MDGGFHFRGAIGNIYGVMREMGDRCIKKSGYLMQIDHYKNNFFSNHGRIL